MTPTAAFPTASTISKLTGTRIQRNPRSPSGQTAYIPFWSARRVAQEFAQSFAVAYRMSVSVRQEASGWVVAMPVTDDF